MGKDLTSKLLKWSYTILLLLSMAILRSDTLSSGPPTFTCDNMAPRHGFEASRELCPFGVTFSKDSFAPSEVIEVTLASREGVSFKGFWLQARRAFTSATRKYGSYEVLPGTKVTKCINDETFSHANNNWKTSVTVNWTAPVNFQGDIEFWYTVNYNFSVHWERERSKTLTGPKGNGTVTTTPVPSTKPEQTPIRDVVVTNCGGSKGCYRIPSMCGLTFACSSVVTWTDQGDRVDFEMSGSMGSDETYIAVALSTDLIMGDDSVISCLFDENKGVPEVQLSWNTVSKVNEPLSDPHLVLLSTAAYFADGRMICRFSYLKNATSKASQQDLSKVANLNNPVHLQVAKGPLMSGYMDKHPAIPAIAPDTVVVTSASYQDIGGAASFPLVKAHGCLMILAWMLFASIGVMMPRYYKPTFPGKTFMKMAIWFNIHRASMVAVFVLTLVGFVLIFIEVGGYSKNTTLPQAVHPPLGIIVTILTVVNPFMSMARCPPSDPKRKTFNIAHFLVGQGAHCLGVATIFLGMYMSKSKMPGYSIWFVTAFIIWHTVIEITLAAYSRMLLKPKNVTPKTNEVTLASYSTSDSKMELTVPEPEVKTAPADGTGLKASLMGVYLAGNLVLTIWLMYLIIKAEG